MNKEKIKEAYPKAFNQLVNWMKETIQSTITTNNSLPKELMSAFKINDATVDTAINMTLTSPEGIRGLYNFFDKYELYFTPFYVMTNRWSCIIPDDQIDETIYYPTREEAEQVGFERCFEILNEKI